MEITISSKSQKHQILFNEIFKSIIKVEKFSSNTSAIEEYSFSPIHKYNVFSNSNTRIYFDDGKTLTIYNKDFVCMEGDLARIFIGTYDSKSFACLIQDTITGSITQLDTPKNILGNILKLVSITKLINYSILVVFITFILIIICSRFGTILIIPGIILCSPFYYICISKCIKELIKVFSNKYTLISKSAETKFIKDFHSIIMDFIKGKQVNSTTKCNS